MKTALVAIFAVSAFASDCLPYGTTVTLRGRVDFVDENGAVKGAHLRLRHQH